MSDRMKDHLELHLDLSKYKRIFVSSDEHFCHPRILFYARRPFNSIQEMEQVIVKNWNSIVSPEDVVIVCGDFAFVGVKKSKQILDSLNGTKILVLGNHDDNIARCKRMGFDSVCTDL